MAQPGWYQDPNGQGYRYWDGDAWTDQVISSNQANAESNSSPRTWLIVMAAAVALTLMIVGIWWAVGRGGPDPGPKPPGQGQGEEPSSRPTGSVWNERVPTESPEDPGEEGEWEECPNPEKPNDYGKLESDGRLHAGKLSVVPPDRFTVGRNYWPGAAETNSANIQIAAGWQSQVSVGRIMKSDGYKDPKSAARQLMECASTSSIFNNFQRREDLKNEPITIDGHEGWWMQSEIYVNFADPDIQGDVVNVIVLDTGEEDSFGIFVSAATIGLEENLKEVEESRKTLRGK